MSNKFNKLTQQLTRPKVCKSPPSEMLNGICETSTLEETVKLGDQAFFNVLAWFDELPFQEAVSMSVTPQISEVSEQENPINENLFTGNFELDNLTTLGHEIITVKVVFSDGSVCFAFPEMTWVPE